MRTIIFAISLFSSLLVVINAQESLEETTTSIPTTQEVLVENIDNTDNEVIPEEDNAGVKTSTSSGEFLPTPTLSSNPVTSLVPSLKKNILDAKSRINATEIEILENESANEISRSRDIFRRRNDNGPVIVRRNSTAAEILLKKVKSSNRYRTYHDPSFKNKKLVRVRPRAKSLQELKSSISPTSQTTTNSTNLVKDSPILTSNVLLLADNQRKFPPQGSQPFDWSKRQSRFKNRFNLLKTTRIATNEPPKVVSTSTEATNPPTVTVLPESDTEESTEVHVVTSVSDEIGVSPTLGISTTSAPAPTTPISITNKSPNSYSFISIGSSKAKENVLELERLFLNEKLKTNEDSDKIKRKVKNFLKDQKPVKVDSSITVISDLYENNDYQGKKGKKPPIHYQAPSDPFNPERVKDFIKEPEVVEKKTEEKAKIRATRQPIAAIKERVAESESDDMSLDDMIIKSVEEALAIRVPKDPMLRHRGDIPELKATSEEVRVSAILL